MNKLVCELCGSNSLTKTDDLFVCDYCRTRYTPEQARKMLVEGTIRVDRSGDIGSLKEIATKALESNNNKEALEYANRILEIDPKNSAAWYIKGVSSGWLSSINNLRIIEMINAFKSCIDYAEDEERERIKESCASQVNIIGVACWNTSLNHVNQFASVDGAWEGHVVCGRHALEGFRASYVWHTDRQPLENIVTVAASLINGAAYQYWDPVWNAQRTKVRQLSDADKAEMHSLIESTSEKIRETDKDYVTPKPVTQTGCFVVTATMGDEDAAPVIVLREFRDVILVKHKYGRSFVKWYYAVGPNIASRIKQSRVLRLCSLIFVVLPSASIAFLYLKSRRNNRI